MFELCKSRINHRLQLTLLLHVVKRDIVLQLTVIRCNWLGLIHMQHHTDSPDASLPDKVY
jgi:hypothetical protein